MSRLAPISMMMATSCLQTNERMSQQKRRNARWPVRYSSRARASAGDNVYNAIMHTFVRDEAHGMIQQNIFDLKGSPGRDPSMFILTTSDSEVKVDG